MSSNDDLAALARSAHAAGRAVAQRGGDWLDGRNELGQYLLRAFDVTTHEAGNLLDNYDAGYRAGRGAERCKSST